MPLFVKPKATLSRDDVHALMSGHYEDTFFDPAKDAGAGSEHTPYRWNGLQWELGTTRYVNERVVGTQSTSWHFVASLRADVPKPMGVLMHWGADDHTWAPKIPIHGGATAVHASCGSRRPRICTPSPHPVRNVASALRSARPASLANRYDDSNCTGRDACRLANGLEGTVLNFSWNSAWWVAQAVADQVYTRMDRAAPVVRKAQQELHDKLDAACQDAEAAAKAKFAAGDVAGGQAMLTAQAVQAGADATKAWTALWQQLTMLFVDGKMTKPNPKDEVCGCDKPSATFNDAWKAKVVADDGDHYLVPNQKLPLIAASQHHNKPTRNKLTIRGVSS